MKEFKLHKNWDGDLVHRAPSRCALYLILVSSLYNLLASTSSVSCLLLIKMERDEDSQESR
jgi:hypothetical protein